MDRRQLFASISFCLFGAGCVENAPAVGPQTERRSPTNRSQNVSAELVELRFDKPHKDDTPTPPTDEDGNYRQTVTANFDCADRSVLLDGWIHSNTCRTIIIKSASYDEERHRATVVLYPKWDNPKPPESVDCGGAKYNYRIRLKVDHSLPQEVRVLYEWPDGKSPNGENPLQFTLSNDEC